MINKETKIAVCGAGAMGAGIAQIAAQAGHEVVVLDQHDDALSRGKSAVAKGAGALLKRGKIDEREAAAIEDRVRWTLNQNDLKECGLVIEAIVEKAEIKQALFESIEAANPEAVIATNTSSLSVSHLAAGLRRPSRFLGLHFFNPAPIMKLVEVVPGGETDPALIDAAIDLMRAWGKVAVKAKDVPGFIVNRVARPFYGEGWRAYEEGAADPATLDFLYRDLAGFRMGPFELGDLIGHDVNTAAAQSVYAAYFGRTRFVPSLAQAQLAASGRLGRKTGRGVYDYGEGAEKPAPRFVEAPSFSAPLRPALHQDAEQLAALFAVAKVNVEKGDGAPPSGFASVNGALIGFTKGETAGALARRHQQPVAVLDWMRDPAAASAIAFAASDEAARDAALAIAAATGKKAVELTDRPGLVVFRTLAQLANCAGDAVRDCVGEPPAVDQAMKYGVNYPFGPFEWAFGQGAGQIAGALDAIAAWTGDPLYNASETLRALS